MTGSVSKAGTILPPKFYLQDFARLPNFPLSSLSRASLTVRFTVKSGDPPGAGKIWDLSYAITQLKLSVLSLVQTTVGFGNLVSFSTFWGKLIDDLQKSDCYGLNSERKQSLTSSHGSLACVLLLLAVF